MENDPALWNESDEILFGRFNEFYVAFRERLEGAISGQREVLDEILAALFVGERVLTTGVSGLGKKRIVREISSALSLTCDRVEFTEDMTPREFVETILSRNNDYPRESVGGEFETNRLFPRVLIAEDIDRAAPKTQAVFFEAALERRLRLERRVYELERPFFAIATRNPIERSDACPLTETQLDRFLFSSKMDFPKTSEETEMVLRTSAEEFEPEPPLVSVAQFKEFQRLIRRVVVSRPVAERAVKIVRKTRPQTKISSEAVQKYVEWGAGPGASRAIVLGAKAFAAFAGRSFVEPSDLERVAVPVLRDRIVLNKFAKSEGTDVDLLIRKILREARIESERDGANI
ncbi:MAG: MoxR family ATPase [Thermoguttaceae bacterium]|nr:MoxR family ATPase [Thermoguttaceae bacterium]